MRVSLTAFLCLGLPMALSCNLQPNSIGPLPFKQTIGDDCPADPATSSYFINHASVTVSNITASRDWYRDILGMRHIFTVELSDKYTITYMGHSQGGRNGRGYQEGKELARDKNNLAGLIEFVEYKGTLRKFVPGPSNTFSHFGLIVDDVAAAQARFDSLGVSVVKRVDELDFSPETGSPVVAAAWAFDNLVSEETQAAIKAVVPGLMAIGFKQFCIIADPDGNLFEVQQFSSEAI